MVTLNDKYIPMEGINYSFTEIENCELESRPSMEWFKGKDFWFRKRFWLETNPLRETRWDLKGSNFFTNSVYSYTDQWFVYTFDGQNMTSVSSVPAATITQATGNTNLQLDVAWLKLRQWQEFTATQNSVIRSVTFSMKSVGVLTASTIVRCRITTALDKTVSLATSETTYPGTLITGAYGEFTFLFNNLYIPNAWQYFAYIEAENTDWTNYIDVHGQTGNPYAWGASFFYNWTVWAANGTTDLKFIINMTWALFYDSRFSEDTVVVSYLGWGRYPNATTTRTINTYNNVTGVMVLTVALPGAVWDFIWKYIYIQTGTWARQYSLISAQTSSTSITIWNLFDIAAVPADTVVFYNSLEPQLLIPQLRRGSWVSDVTHLYSISRSWQNNFWSFSNSKKLLFRDNRIVSLALNWQSLSFHDLIYIEIPSLNVIKFGNEEALDVADFWSYLICFFKNKVGIVRKITNTTSWTVTYSYQDLVSTGLYSEKSYLIKGSDLYIFSSDKRLYSVNISTLTINELSAELKDQGIVLENYFDAFREWWKINFTFAWGILRLIYKINSVTEVYKYIEWYEVWVRDTYRIALNFLSWLYSINDEIVTWYGNNFVRFWGIQDLWVNISQRIKIYWPEEWKLSTFTLLKTKLRIGFDYLSQIWGRIYVKIGWYKLYNRMYDLGDIAPIQEINTVIASEWLVGSGQVAQYTIWGELFSADQLKTIYPEILDVWFNVWRRWQYFTIEIINDEKKQLYLNAINPMYNTESPLIIYNKWVISWQ
jgi:hypothetical protein